MTVYDLLIGVFFLLVIHQVAKIVFPLVIDKKVVPLEGFPDDIADETIRYIQTIQEKSAQFQAIEDAVREVSNPDRCLYCAGHLPEQSGFCRGCGAPYSKPPKDSKPPYQVVRQKETHDRGEVGLPAYLSMPELPHREQPRV